MEMDLICVPSICIISLSCKIYGPYIGKTWRWSIVSVIWIGVIIPLIILLPVWQYGLVSKTGLMVLMVFILFFIALGSLPIVIKFLIFCEFRIKQVIGLSFIGLIIPLTVYVPIILYVPSSKTIIIPILAIQPTLVLLVIILIIFKLNGIDLMIVNHVMNL